MGIVSEIIDCRRLINVKCSLALVQSEMTF